jgi:predicted glycoside hydrolase/deacetylase ChbG (UPF0249 family)
MENEAKELDELKAQLEKILNNHGIYPVHYEGHKALMEEILELFDRF